MRYKLTITCPELKTIRKVRELLEQSEVYRSDNIMSLSLIREVCDECASKK